MKNQNLPLFSTFKSSVGDQLLNNQLIKLTLKNFFKEIIQPLKKDQVVLILFKIKFFDENNFEYIRTLGSLLKINKKEFSRLYNILSTRLELSDNEYRSTPIIELIINYKIIDENNTKISKNIYPQKERLTIHKIKNISLPTTMNLKLWGLELNNINNIIRIQKYRSKFIYEVELISPLIRNIKILVGNEVLLTFKDILIDELDQKTFSRYLDKSEYHYVKGKVNLKIVYKNTFNLKRLELFVNRKNQKIIPLLDERFLTLDIETQLVNNIISPIMIDIFDGTNHFNFFLPDFKTVEEMIITALNELLKPHYHNHKIYIHNLSNFDGIFLLKYLISNEQLIINPTFKDGKMINIDVKFGYNHRYKISFRDSYLILLFSLSKLAKNFNVGGKGSFEFKKVDNLNNKGLQIIKEELSVYCKNDTYILFKIIQKFNYLIFNKWHLNINNYPTLPSVAMALFKSKFLIENQVCVIKGIPFKEIKNSYTGGSTDMYIPHGQEIFGYDINSLYPHSMANNPVPVNNMKYFEGNMENIDNLFGFFYVEIEAPNNLNIPILQIHYNNRTISPLGKFSGWFFSEELKQAADLFGYKFHIIKGYTFDKANIFKDYINELYSLRLTYPKSDPMNYIAKLLMNSLYGRFGLNPLLPETQIIDKDMLDDFIDYCEISELIEFDSKILLQYLDENKIKNFNNDKMEGEISSNIAIASAITAYSRMTMADIKNYCLNNGIKIYYSDTDSVFTDKPLPDHFVGKAIGQFKLESISKEAVFLAPKVYGLVDKDTGQEIIKVKGYKNKNITFNELKSLLKLNKKLELNHEKWFKSIVNSNIIIKNQIYTLKVTNNKRNLMYNKANILFDSKPFILG
jgi:DNA polymerase type B, organellar and viral